MKRSHDAIMSDFFHVTMVLEPDSLYQDGEATPAQVRRTLADCKAMWERLEKELGRKVSEGEAFDWYVSKEKV